MKKKIYFKGYYGFKNLGDDIFCVAADWICNNMWENTEAVFIGKNLPKLSDNAKIYRFNNNFIRRIFELFNLFRVDKIIYFGGSLLHSKIKGIFDIKFYLNNFESLYKKLGAIGVSVGPFKKQSDMDSMKIFLKKFKFLYVRDKSSLEILKTMGISKHSRFCFDPAILISDIYPTLKNVKPTKKNKVRLGVSLCHYERYVGGNIEKEKKREKAIETLFDEVIASNKKISEIILFVFHGDEYNGDVEITNDFYKKYKDKIKVSIVDYTKDTEKFCMKLAECDLIFGVRLHSGILAYSLGIPFILVEYHKKCTEFLNTINYYNRFDVDNHEHNIKLFNKMINSIISGSNVYGMKDVVEPEYYKKIMKDEIRKINI